jgi:hypothetical protein
LNAAPACSHNHAVMRACRGTGMRVHDHANVEFVGGSLEKGKGKGVEVAGKASLKMQNCR